MTTTNWIKLEDLPKKCSDTRFKQFNDNQFICADFVSSTDQDEPDLRPNYLNIHKYDQVSDKWTKSSYVVRSDWKRGCILTIDKHSECFYIYSTKGKLFRTDLELTTPELILEGIPQYLHPWQMLYIDGNIILMAENTKGFKIDSRNDMKLTEITRCGNFETIQSIDIYGAPFTSQYIQSQNCILNIVAHVFGNTYIHKYSMINDNVIETDFAFPDNVEIADDSNSRPHPIKGGKGYVLSKDQKYLIMLGGGNGFGKNLCDDIKVFDVEQNILLECELKCPFKGAMHAICMGSDVRDELLVSGYVRELWTSPGFKKMRPFPIALLGVLSPFISIEYVHIVARGYFRKVSVGLEHWKISVDGILDSIIVE